MLTFNILGNLEMVDGSRHCTPSAPKVRSVLALLLLRANRTVSQDSLFHWLWGDDLPRSAATTTQTYVYQIRKLVEREGIVADADELIASRPAGYCLQLGHDQLDADVFVRLTSEGRTLLEEGKVAEAAQRLRGALSLWRGSPLADIDVSGRLDSEVAYLTELRMRALELRIEADSRLSRHRELVSELRGLVAANPLNEWLHGQLIISLNRSGRRGEALQAYQNLRRTLQDELGIDPTLAVQALQRRVLEGSSEELVLQAS